MTKNKYSEFDNIKLAASEIPRTAFLAYSVCTPFNGGCNWRGWIIESLFAKETSEINPQGDPDVLPAADNQKCPNCNSIVYRTGIVAKCSSILIERPQEN